MDNYFYKLVPRLLLRKLTPFFPDLGATALGNALILAQAILLARTTCLNRAKAFVGAVTGRHSTAADSHYKRLIRFFDAHAHTELWIGLVAAAVELLRLKSDRLLLDGTSWRGPDGEYVHLLTLCVLYRGVAVPIAWRDIAKKGASSFAEREALLALAAKRYSLRGRLLIADREYIGREWFALLHDLGIDFTVRSRDEAYFRTVDEARAPGAPRIREAIAAVKRSRKPNKARRFAFRLTPGGPQLYLVVARNPDPKAKERVMLLVTSRDESPYRAVEAYLSRWGIETCFRHLKSNGFDLEVLNLRGRKRQRLLIAVVVVAYVIAVIEGLLTYAKAVPRKRHGSGGRVYPAVSVFRFGLDQLGRHTTDLRTFCRYLYRVFRKAKTGYRSATLSLNV